MAKEKVDNFSEAATQTERVTLVLGLLEQLLFTHCGYLTRLGHLHINL